MASTVDPRSTHLTTGQLFCLAQGTRRISFGHGQEHPPAGPASACNRSKFGLLKLRKVVQYQWMGPNEYILEPGKVAIEPVTANFGIRARRIILQLIRNL